MAKRTKDEGASDRGRASPSPCGFQAFRDAYKKGHTLPGWEDCAIWQIGFSDGSAIALPIKGSPSLARTMKDGRAWFCVWHPMPFMVRHSEIRSLIKVLPADA